MQAGGLVALFFSRIFLFPFSFLLTVSFSFVSLFVFSISRSVKHGTGSSTATAARTAPRSRFYFCEPLRAGSMCGGFLHAEFMYGFQKNTLPAEFIYGFQKNARRASERFETTGVRRVVRAAPLLGARRVAGHGAVGRRLRRELHHGRGRVVPFLLFFFFLTRIGSFRQPGF